MQTNPDAIWQVNGGLYLGSEVGNTEGEPKFLSPKPLQYIGDRHCLTIGPNGSGKSRRLLLPNLIGLTHWSIIVIDPKGELARDTAEYRARQGSRVIILNPYGVGTLQKGGFNPIWSLDPLNEEFVDDALGQAEAIITIDQRSHEPHWAESAQDLVSAAIMYVRLKYGREAAYRHVRDIVGQPDQDIRKTIEDMRETGIIHDWPELTRKASRFLDIDPQNKELNSIISTAMTQTRFLDSRPVKANLDVGDIDFGSLKQIPTTVYIVLPAKRVVTQSSWMRLVVTSALQELMRDATPGKVPVLLAFDESFQLNCGPGGPAPLPAIDRYMPLMRGYGVKLWSVWQDIHQLARVYGDGWQSFVANAGVLQSFAPQDMPTAEFLSDRTGQKTIFLKSLTTGIDIKTGLPASDNIALAPAAGPTMLPMELINMDMGYSVLFTHKTKGTVRSFLPDPSRLPGFAPFASLGA